MFNFFELNSEAKQDVLLYLTILRRTCISMQGSYRLMPHTQLLQLELHNWKLTECDNNLVEVFPS